MVRLSARRFFSLVPSHFVHLLLPSGPDSPPRAEGGFFPPLEPFLSPLELLFQGRGVSDLRRFAFSERRAGVPLPAPLPERPFLRTRVRSVWRTRLFVSFARGLLILLSKRRRIFHKYFPLHSVCRFPATDSLFFLLLFRRFSPSLGADVSSAPLVSFLFVRPLSHLPDLSHLDYLE